MEVESKKSCAGKKLKWGLLGEEKFRASATPVNANIRNPTRNK